MRLSFSIAISTSPSSTRAGTLLILLFWPLPTSLDGTAPASLSPSLCGGFLESVASQKGGKLRKKRGGCLLWPQSSSTNAQRTVNVLHRATSVDCFLWPSVSARTDLPALSQWFKTSVRWAAQSRSHTKTVLSPNTRGCSLQLHNQNGFR